MMSQSNGTPSDSRPSLEQDPQRAHDGQQHQRGMARKNQV